MMYFTVQNHILQAVHQGNLVSMPLMSDFEDRLRGELDLGNKKLAGALAQTCLMTMQNLGAINNALKTFRSLTPTQLRKNTQRALKAMMVVEATGEECEGLNENLIAGPSAKLFDEQAVRRLTAAQMVAGMECETWVESMEQEHLRCAGFGGPNGTVAMFHAPGQSILIIPGEDGRAHMLALPKKYGLVRDADKAIEMVLENQLHTSNEKTAVVVPRISTVRRRIRVASQTDSQMETPASFSGGRRRLILPE